MKDINLQLQRNIQDVLHYDKDNAVENIVKLVFETIMNAERSEFLSESEGNKANGYYQRLAQGINKYFKLNIPRDRLSMFKPVFLECIKAQDEQMQDLAFKLYTKGLTTRDINEVFSEIYDKNLSSSSVSNITKQFEQEREAWLSRELNGEYYFIYIDALFVPVRRDTVAQEAFYIVLGLKPNLQRDVLGVYNIPQESASGWSEVLLDLKSRGLKKCLMVIADGLSGLADVVKQQLPGTLFQRCLVHKIRNLLFKVRAKDKRALADDFHEIFELEQPLYSIDNARVRLDAFIEYWGSKYPSILRAFKSQDIENYFAYLNFPSTIHRMIYTTNWIERLNKEIRRTTKIRNSFPNPDSAMNLICASLINFEQKTYKYPVTAFCKVRDILNAKLDKL